MRIVAIVPGLFLLGAAPQDSSPISFEREIRPLVAKYCGSCHAGARPKGKLDLSTFADQESVFRKRKTWEESVQRLREGEMPPPDKLQPTVAEKALIVRWFAAASAAKDAGPRNPGRAPLRRLNRTEYNQTIRDLLGVDLRPADDFPADDSAHGFDTISEALAMSPLLVEKYVLAAERMLDQILLPDVPDRRFEGAALTRSDGEVRAEIEFPAAGRYVLRVKAAHASAESKPPLLSLRLGGKTLRDGPLDGTTLQTEVLTSRGKAAFSVRAEGARVDALEVSGPVGVPGAKEARARLLIATSGREGAKRTLERFAFRAFRRPVRHAELERLLALFDRAERRGDPFEQALRLPLAAVLSSPQFLFRVEQDRAAEKGAWAVSDYELASRLSYFLWGSMPDERLFELAAKGGLSDPRVLESEVQRMLADPKSKSLVEGFLRAWLQLGAFEYINPDRGLFADFNKDGRVRRAMEDEARLFIEGIVKENRSLLDLLDADYTYMNEPLARFYGLPPVKGDRMQKVALQDRRRGGILTMGAVLAMTSSPDRTSVVKRGKWILERILGAPPPPPPEDAGDLAPTDRKAATPRTLRERLAEHRRDPQCASCHQRIDPLGFSLESFDAVGKWRDTEAGRPVDVAGTLPNGRTFRGPVELKDLLLERKDEFARSAADRALVYALGRELGDDDIPAVRAIAEALAKDGYRFSTLIVETAKSFPFRHRRNGTAKGE
jgi:hypothetical protein